MVEVEACARVCDAALRGVAVRPLGELRDAASARVAAAALSRRRAALAAAAGAAAGGDASGEALLAALRAAAPAEGEAAEEEAQGGEIWGLARDAAALGAQLAPHARGVPLEAAAELNAALVEAQAAEAEAEAAEAALEGASPALEAFERAAGAGEVVSAAEASRALSAAAEALEGRFGGEQKIAAAAGSEAARCRRALSGAVEVAFEAALAASEGALEASTRVTVALSQGDGGGERAQEPHGVRLRSLLAAAAILQTLSPLAEGLAEGIMRYLCEPLLAAPLRMRTHTELGDDAAGGRRLLTVLEDDTGGAAAAGGGDRCAEAERACVHAEAILRFVGGAVSAPEGAPEAETGEASASDAAATALLTALWRPLSAALLAGPLAAAVPTELSELPRFKSLAARAVALGEVAVAAGVEAGTAGTLAAWAAEADVAFAKKRGAAALATARDALMQSAREGGGRTPQRLATVLQRSVSFMRAAAALDDAGAAGRAGLPLCASFCVTAGAEAAAAAADACLTDAAAAAAEGALAVRDTFVECSAACLDLPRALMTARVAVCGGAARCEMLLANDCARSAHAAVTLAAAARVPCGERAAARLVATAAALRREADEARAEAAQNHDAELAAILDSARGFVDAGADAASGRCELPRAVASAGDTLQRLARAWGAVADEEVAVETLSFLVDESLDRFAREVLALEDIGVEDCEALHTLAVAAAQWADCGRGAAPGGGSLPVEAPQAARVRALAMLLDARLADIPALWEDGALSEAGLEAAEVAHLVRAVFAPSEHRVDALRRLGA